MKRAIVTIFAVIVGAITGFMIPYLTLFVIAVVISSLSGNSQGGGVLGFLMIPLAPIGVIAGVVIAVMMANRRYAPKRGFTDDRIHF